MRSNIILAIGLVVAGAASSVQAQDVIWRAAKPAQESATLSLGRPEPIAQVGFVPLASSADSDVPRVVRGQAPPPPPDFPASQRPPSPCRRE